jgi:8-amino-7-oxononanoate synthase
MSQEWIDEELRGLDAALRRRRLVESKLSPDGWIESGGERLLNLSSNDYLGLAAESADGAATGAGASRLVVGNDPLYAHIEQRLALLKGAEAALVFGSGYLANIGIIPALVGRGDTVFSDRLNHASIVDGIQLSRARHVRYRHGDADHLAELLRSAGDSGRRLIVTESVFSMDGDTAPLKKIADLAAQHDAMLMVDEAHSGGLYGEAGCGLVGALGLSEVVDVQMGTFSKAYGCYGAYAVGSRSLIDLLVTRARSAIYTTALPPVVLQSIVESLDVVAAADERRKRLAENAEQFRSALAAGGLQVGGESAIIPVIVGADKAALAAAEALRDAGIAAVAIRPPTVPEGTARIRFTVTAVHQPQALDDAATTIVQVIKGVLP